MEIIDQLNQKVIIDKIPKRIISLVPSQTEFLFDLGLDEEVVGITKFCIHPKEWYKNKEKIGGTKNLNLDKIISLKPHLIIGNKEENTKKDIDFLKEKFPVYMSDIFHLDDSYQMMKDIGFINNRKEKAEEIIHEIKHNFTDLPKISKKVLYFIWKDPYMTAGKNTFINHILEKCGFINLANDFNERYDSISEEKITSLPLDFIFLSSEPYPFKEKHINELKKITQAKIIIVDGEMFSWYGSRLINFKKYFEKILLPTIQNEK